MGIWDSNLFSNDTTLDIRDTYLEFLKQTQNHDEAYQKTVEEYREIMGTDEEPFFWYSIADTQWNYGHLMPQVKSKALDLISVSAGISYWKETPNKVNKWERTLKRLRDKIESDAPLEKKIIPPVEFVHNPWNTGDIYAYRFHTKKAKNNDLFGKYILFQKIGNVQYWDGLVFSVIQVFKGIFDVVPQLSKIGNIQVLPLVPYIKHFNVEDYVPSFDWYLRSTMIYDSEDDFPKKFFTFVGNDYMPETDYIGNEMTSLHWDKNDMEDWLIDYYLGWENIEEYTGDGSKPPKASDV